MLPDLEGLFGVREQGQHLVALGWNMAFTAYLSDTVIREMETLYARSDAWSIISRIVQKIGSRKLEWATKQICAPS